MFLGNWMKKEKIEKLKKEIKACKKCPLYKSRKNPVVGEGSLNAKIMFIGEAPGASEDATGRPFCGAAGKVLDELLESAGIERSQVYIANILKCRPPGNRNPRAEEIRACTFYLERQIRIINPEVICTLGNFATSFIFKKYGLTDKLEGISKLHGKVFSAGDLFTQIKIIPLYHPAVATYNINMKEILKRDFQLLKSYK